MNCLRARFYSIGLLVMLAVSAIPSGAQVDHSRDLGEVNFPISCSEDAQQEFNRAVTLLHHMTYEQAREAFVGITETEPSCAMGHWGIAMTLFQPLWPTRPDAASLARGWSEVERANIAAEHATEREQLFIASIEAFFSDPVEGEYWDRIRRWEEAMQRLYEAYPEDVEASAFFALAHLATAAPGSLLHHERASEILLNIYVENPQHPGASHYTIHANDVLGRESESADVVRGYSRIAPRNPHAIHMPTHIDVRQGSWRQAVAGNILAADASLESTVGPEGEYVWSEFAHMIGYLVYSYLQVGDDHAAAEQVERFFATSPLQPDFKAAFHSSEIPARFALEREAWEEATSLVPRPLVHLNWDRYWWPEAVTWFARGFGSVKLGLTADAADALTNIRSLEAAARAAGEAKFGVEIEMLRLELGAWIAMHHGDAVEAEQLLVEAARLELATPKQPITPAPILPAFEQLGDLYLELSRPADALDAYESALHVAPGRLRSLAGAARAASTLGSNDVAENYYQRLIEQIVEGSQRRIAAEARLFLADR